VRVHAGIVQVGRYQGFTDRRLHAVYLDRLPYHGPKSWRLILARHPIWEPFSEHYGYQPGPRVTRLGPLDIAWYGHPKETT